VTDGPDAGEPGAEPRLAVWTRLVQVAAVAIALLALSLPFRSDRNVVDFPLSVDG
jgi:hypothetical protein